MSPTEHCSGTVATISGQKKFLDPSRNIIFLRDSCQIVRPVSAKDLPPEFTRDNHGLTSPGNVAAYLEVVDLADSKLRYIFNSTSWTYNEALNNELVWYSNGQKEVGCQVIWFFNAT